MEDDIFKRKSVAISDISSIKIVSDGTASGTTVYNYDGQIIPYVTKVQIEIDADKEIVEAVLHIVAATSNISITAPIINTLPECSGEELINKFKPLIEKTSEFIKKNSCS